MLICILGMFQLSNLCIVLYSSSFRGLVNGDTLESNMF